MGQLDSIVFGDKKFSDILHEIYENQTTKKQQITLSHLSKISF